MAQIQIELEYGQRVHYALQQNDVPVVQLLRLHNHGDEDLADLEVVVRVEPAASEPFALRLQTLPAGGSHRFDGLKVPLRPGVLAGLTERQAGTLHIEVLAGPVVVASAVRPIELLAYNEWPGSATLPELLAAFVLPNHPEVGRVLSRAAHELARATGSSALDGYQRRDPGRVRAMAQAVYDAIQAVDLTYVMPPASFEATGQKVRTPEQVFTEHLATCLDLAVLMAACYEQAGLHALLILVEGHAFVGVWLVDETFPEATVADPLRLRKRVDLDEIVVVECTGLCGAPGLAFGEACSAARRRLVDNEAFQHVLDVTVARRLHIRPLPLRTSGYEAVDGESAPDLAAAAAAAEIPPTIVQHAPPPATTEVVVEPEELATPEGRVERWQRRLLDTTLRNRLLNFIDTKKVLPLEVIDASALEDSLASGNWFRVQVMSRLDSPTAAASPRDAEQVRETYLQEELRARRLHTGLSETDLDRRLLEIHRAAKISLDEGGANTLYLAVGFLRWYEAPSSEKERVAPLLLLPLELERVSVAAGFRLRLADEDARVNTTLLQKLETDYGLPVQGLDELPEDEAGLDVPAILRRFRVLVKDVDRWEVVEDVRIGFFSFTKYLMWLDLHRRSEQLMGNRLLRHLIETPQLPFVQDGVFPAAETLDDERDPGELYCPKDADSSQLCAVLAGADGRSFVLEGPPGTGKSQTITNLIAHCIAEGKRVLFVAEKRAALEVVYKRLSDVGLGPFCLELHSNKGSKKAVLAQLGRALETARERAPEEWDESARRLRESRDELNRYVGAIHGIRGFGWSLFQCLGRLVELRQAPLIEGPLGRSNAVTADEFAGMQEHAARLQAAATDVGPPHQHPWRAVRWRDWQPASTAQLTGTMDALATSTQGYEGAAAQLAEVLRAPASSSRLELGAMTALSVHLRRAPAVPAALAAGSGFAERKARIEHWVELGRERDRLRAGLFERYHPGILELLLQELIAAFRRWGHAFPPLRWLCLRGPRRQLRGVARGPLGVSAEVIDDLETAQQLQVIEKDLAGFGVQLREWLGGLADASAWQEVEAAVTWAEQLREHGFRCAGGDSAVAEDLLAHWASVAAEPAATMGPDTVLGRAFADADARRADFDRDRQALVDFLELDEELAFAAEEAPGYLESIGDRLNSWRGHMPSLRDWCA